MNKIVFSKYSNDRNDNYKIRTDIIKLDGTNELVVEKSGVTAGGAKHIEHMYGCYIELKEQFKNTMIRPNVGEMTENGAVRLEYVKGVTLEKLLDDCLASSNLEQFEKYLDSFCTQIRSVAMCDFKPDDIYESVFGENSDKDTNQKAMKCSDIDMIFENIVISNDKWNLLDYEWTFHMSIPVDFVIFRAAHYYATPDRENYLQDIDIYKMMGINPDKIKTYIKMEESFQSYVVKDNKPLWKLYELMGKGACFPTGLAERELMIDRIQVLKDFGDGFVGLDKYIPVRPDPNGMVEISIDVEPGVKTVRIDPADCRCILHIEEMIGYGEEEYEIQYGSNGLSTDNKQICFDTNDPQVWIGDLRDGLNRIHFRYHIDVLNDYMIKQYNDGINSFNDMRGELEKNQADLLGSRMLADMKENEIQECKRIIELREGELKGKDELLELKDAQILQEAQKNEQIVNGHLETIGKLNENAAKAAEIMDAQKAELASQDELMRAQSLVMASKDEVIAVQTERIRHLEDVIDGINNSVSWKITKPIRTVKCAVIKKRKG